MSEVLIPYEFKWGITQISTFFSDTFGRFDHCEIVAFATTCKSRYQLRYTVFNKPMDIYKCSRNHCNFQRVSVFCSVFGISLSIWYFSPNSVFLSAFGNSLSIRYFVQYSVFRSAFGISLSVRYFAKHSVTRSAFGNSLSIR